MVYAIVQEGYGGVEVLKVRPIELPPPAAGEVRIRHTAIGVNFHDIYVREGINRALPLPGIPGIEAVGEVTALGEGVSGWRVGDRVACITRRYGAYSSERNIAAELLVAPSETLSDEIVACSLLRGLTAAVLLTQLKPVEPSHRVLVHAASGATGRLLTAWASHLGARVVGTVSTAAKQALTVGCDAVVLNTDPGWVHAAREALGGEGADLVGDSIGAPTFEGSLEVAAPRGHVALFGQAGGPVANVPIAALARKSLSVSRPIVFDWYPGAAAVRMIQDFYSLVDQGVLFIEEPEIVSLRDIARAQSLLEDRAYNGALVLRPEG